VGTRCPWCSTTLMAPWTIPRPNHPLAPAAVLVAAQVPLAPLLRFVSRARLRAAGSGASHFASVGTDVSTSRTQTAPQSPRHPGQRPGCEAIRFERRRSSSMLTTFALLSRSSSRANRLQCAPVAVGSNRNTWHCGRVGSTVKRYKARTHARSRVRAPHTYELPK
jgi:hypothetical protein